MILATLATLLLTFAPPYEAIVLLLVDLVKWQSGGTTWSEAIWEVNQHSLGFALGVGVVLGHCFTVPKGLK